MLLSTARLTGIAWQGTVAVVGAGEPVRPLDAALRQRGSHLPIHPDAFGETPVGSMVATACTSGIGMGLGGIGAAISGVEVVTGAGQILWTGAASHELLPPLMREGIPDLTGIFLGSEGGIGIVTRVGLPARRPPWRVRLSGAWAGDPGSILEWGRKLAGIYDTFRIVGPGGGRPWRVDLWVVSPFSAKEAAFRAVEVSRLLGEAGVGALEARAESTGTWAGDAEEHAAFAARARLAGIDVNAPYEAAPELSAVAERLVAAQRQAGVAETRIAWYLAPDFVNLGVHATILHSAPVWTRELEAPFYAELRRLPVIPYRLGATWPAGWCIGLGRTRTALRSLKQQFDPDGILCSGLAAWT